MADIFDQIIPDAPPKSGAAPPPTTASGANAAPGTPAAAAPQGDVFEQLPESELKDVQAKDIPSVPPVSASGIDQALNAVGEFGKGVWKQVNPVAIGQGITQAVAHPVETYRNIGASEKNVLDKVVDAYHRKQYGEAINHAANLFPLIGPQMEEWETEAPKNPAGVSGEVLGWGVPFFSGIRGLVPKAPRPVSVPSAAVETYTPAETAAEVAKTSTPENVLQNFMKARDVEAAKQTYLKASPAMRQTMQQQVLMQTMKESGGDAAQFGQLMDQWKDALPMEDHQAWEGAKKVAQWQQMAAQTSKATGWAETAADVGRLLKIPGMAHVAPGLAVARTVSKLMATGGGRSVLSRLGSLPTGSPAFRSLWGAAMTGNLARAGQAMNVNQPYRKGGAVGERHPEVERMLRDRMPLMGIHVILGIAKPVKKSTT